MFKFLRTRQHYQRRCYFNTSTNNNEEEEKDNLLATIVVIGLICFGLDHWCDQQPDPQEEKE
jgi:hypothetical protein